jgi:hypothetical protein
VYANNVPLPRQRVVLVMLTQSLPELTTNVLGVGAIVLISVDVRQRVAAPTPSPSPHALAAPRLP